MSVILHSDLNCFYASVEMNEQPQLKGKKVAVCGSTENRHGIVLTASYPAKRSGVKTGMANWQAKQACPGLIMVDPHYDLYLKYSRIVRRIYQRYSEIIEPFGMDENWIQLPFTNDVEGIGFQTAEKNPPDRRKRNRAHRLHRRQLFEDLCQARQRHEKAQCGHGHPPHRV